VIITGLVLFLTCNPLFYIFNSFQSGFLSKESKKGDEHACTLSGTRLTNEDRAFCGSIVASVRCNVLQGGASWGDSIRKRGPGRTEQVCTNILGMSDDEFRDLFSDGAFGEWRAKTETNLVIPSIRSKQIVQRRLPMSTISTRRMLAVILIPFTVTLMGDVWMASGGSLPFPEKPVTIIVGFAAGGPGDLTARALAEAANRHSPRPFSVC